ncbi:anthranilate synthase component I family protein [Candidatus Nomurabacteria bacterium]|nr:anthranilate synthase component I family protein [Candidatus Nomurabacteria bacterium]
MNSERKAFKQSFAQAKAENRRRATLIRTVPMRDPFVVYQSVCGYAHETACILESATHNGTEGHFSYVCVSGVGYSTINEKSDLGFLKEMLRRDCPPLHATLPFVGGAVGFFSHELITLVEETVSLHSTDPFGLPLGELCFFANVIVFDHEKQEMHYVANVWIEDKTEHAAYEDGCGWLKEMERMVRNEPSKRNPALIGPIESNMTREEYHQMVLRGKEHIAMGDVFQVVLSQRFQAPYETNLPEGRGLSLYSKLRELNPSPYMFHMDFGSSTKWLTLMGASPEIAVHIAKEEMRIRPIAGTRKRGATPVEDERLAAELRSDPKELAEHRMLVDLARNDVGRYCQAGSIHIPELMQVELYSNVMHLTSEVRGKLRDGVHPLDACLGSLPAGTLSGAPKVRALQIIAELEKSRRGPYSGAFGWMTDQAIDTCIFIRSAMLLKGMLYWQSGGGIVADSDPESEYQESLAKARAIETALKQIGNHWKPHGT